MLKSYLLAPLAGLALLAAAPLTTRAQTTPSGAVGIGTTTPNASAALEIQSTSKGLLPRLTLAQRQALTASTTAPPVPGLVIYQTDNTPGLYAYDGAAWVRLGADNLGNHTATQALDLQGNPLVGNGGTTGLTISSTGNAAVAGNVQVPAASAYTYAAPKAYSILYPASDFEPENSSAGPNSAVGTARLMTGSLTAGIWGAYASVANGVLRMPLRVPLGARITSIEVFYDNTNPNSNLRMYLQAYSPPGNANLDPAYPLRRHLAPASAWPPSGFQIPSSTTRTTCSSCG